MVTPERNLELWRPVWCLRCGAYWQHLEVALLGHPPEGRSPARCDALARDGRHELSFGSPVEVGEASQEHSGTKLDLGIDPGEWNGWED